MSVVFAVKAEEQGRAGCGLNTRIVELGVGDGGCSTWCTSATKCCTLFCGKCIRAHVMPARAAAASVDDAD